MKVRILDRAAFNAAVPRLAEILVDAVDAGAGVSFMWPLERAEAEAFWRGIDPVQNRVFAAEEKGAIAGTVMLQPCWQPNQPHRCEVAKLLVHRDFRRQGAATALMAALEAEAREMGRSLVTFDAVAGSPADAFYRGLGFIRAGVIPGYAYSGRGELDGTAIFYKRL
jgi:GNAT superfamily N-acetyltransferase